MNIKNIFALCFFIASCGIDNDKKQSKNNKQDNAQKEVNQFLQRSVNLSQQEIKDNEVIFKDYSLQNIKDLWENSYKNKDFFMSFLRNKNYGEKTMNMKKTYQQKSLGMYARIKELTGLDDKNNEFSEFKKYIDEQTNKIPEEDTKITDIYREKIRSIFDKCFNMISTLETKSDKKNEFFKQYKSVINNEAELKKLQLESLKSEINNILKSTSIINEDFINNYELDQDQDNIQFVYNNHVFNITLKDCGLTENSNIKDSNFVKNVELLNKFINGKKEFFQKDINETFNTFIQKSPQDIFNKRFDWIKCSNKIITCKKLQISDPDKDKFISYYLECLTIYFEKQIKEKIKQLMKDEGIEQEKSIYDHIAKIIDLSSSDSLNDAKNKFGDVLESNFIRKLNDFMVLENKKYSNIDSYLENIFQDEFFTNKEVNYEFIIKSFKNYGNFKFWEIINPTINKLNEIKTNINNDFYIGNIQSFDDLKKYMYDLYELKTIWEDCKKKINDHFKKFYGDKNIQDAKKNHYYFIYEYFEELIYGTPNMVYNKFHIGQYVLIKKESYSKDKDTIFKIDNKEALTRLIEIFFYDDYSATDKKITFINGSNTIKYDVKDIVSSKLDISINNIKQNINGLIFKQNIISLKLCPINKQSNGIVLNDSNAIAPGNILEENKDIFNGDIKDLIQLLDEDISKSILSIKLFDKSTMQEYTISYGNGNKTKKND